jgi:hypothetical protein
MIAAESLFCAPKPTQVIGRFGMWEAGWSAAFAVSILEPS